MYRWVLVSVLSLAFLSGVATTAAGPPELWLQAPDGSNTINLLVGETGVIQLWMDYTNPRPAGVFRMFGMDAMLWHREDYGHDFEVVGFIGHGPWPSDSFQKSRGILDEGPYEGTPDITGAGNLNWYQMQLDAPIPCATSNGLDPNLGPILLDEIIIRGLNDTGSSLNRVAFGSGGWAPSFIESVFYGGEPDWTMYDFVLGTGGWKNPLYVHVSTPEAIIPAVSQWGLIFMGVLVLAAGAVVLRTRRRTLPASRIDFQ